MEIWFKFGMVPKMAIFGQAVPATPNGLHIGIDIDKAILENIEKEILENIDIDKI